MSVRMTYMINRNERILFILSLDRKLHNSNFFSGHFDFYYPRSHYTIHGKFIYRSIHEYKTE